MGEFVAHQGPFPLPELEAEAKKILESCDTSKGWTLTKEKGGVKCYFQKSEKSPFYLFMGEGKISESVETFMEFFKDINSTKVVDPMYLGGEEIEVLNDNHHILRFRYQLPPMITNRDFLFHEFEGIVSTEPKIGAIIGVSIEHEKCKVDPKFIRGNIMASGWVFEEVAPNECNVRFIAQTDPRGWLPVWVVNLVTADQSLNVLRLKEHFEKLKGKGKVEEKEEKEKEKEEKKEEGKKKEGEKEGEKVEEKKAEEGKKEEEVKEVKEVKGVKEVKEVKEEKEEKKEEAEEEGEKEEEEKGGEQEAEKAGEKGKGRKKRKGKGKKKGK